MLRSRVKWVLFLAAVCTAAGCGGAPRESGLQTASANPRQLESLRRLAAPRTGCPSTVLRTRELIDGVHEVAGCTDTVEYALTCSGYYRHLSVVAHSDGR